MKMNATVHDDGTVVLSAARHIGDRVLRSHQVFLEDVSLVRREAAVLADLMRLKQGEREQIQMALHVATTEGNNGD